MDIHDNELLDLLWEQPKARRKSRFSRSRKTHDGFRCLHCEADVCSHPLIAGVRNRNHCPYCLWSRHLDLDHPGDRLSACKEKMQPIGLTQKKSQDKYGQQKGGELMLIHRCLGCGKISINRLAADDDADTLLEVFAASLRLDGAIRAQLEHSGIQMLEVCDLNIVRASLFGEEIGVH